MHPMPLFIANWTSGCSQCKLKELIINPNSNITIPQQCLIPYQCPGGGGPSNSLRATFSYGIFHENNHKPLQERGPLPLIGKFQKGQGLSKLTEKKNK